MTKPQSEITYSQRRKIVQIKEFTHRVHVSGSGSNAIFQTATRGWGVVLEPGMDVFFVGAEKPAFLPGQYVTFSIKGSVQNAATSAAASDHDNKDVAPGRFGDGQDGVTREPS